MHSEKRNPCRLRWSPDPKDSAANQRKRLAALAATKPKRGGHGQVRGGRPEEAGGDPPGLLVPCAQGPASARDHDHLRRGRPECRGPVRRIFPFLPGEKLRRSWDDYTFHRSLLDVALVSAARGLLIFLAYVFCTIVKPRVVLYYRKRQQLERRRKQRDRGYLSLSRGAVDHLSGTPTSCPCSRSPPSGWDPQAPIPPKASPRSPTS